jgi:hypothetical protein
MTQKIMLIVLISLATLLLTAAEGWTAITGSGEPRMDVVQSDGSTLILDVSVPGFYQAPVTADGQTFQKIRFSNEATTHELGKPALPSLNAIVAIPNNQQFRYRITDMQTTVISDILVHPYQTPEKDIQGGRSDAFVMDKRFYAQDASWPNQLASMDKPGIWRDVVISGLHVVPFQYNPAARELEVITSCRIEIEFFGFDADHAIYRDKGISPTFYNMYQASLINFDALNFSRDYTDDVSTKYLIITNTEALSTIQPFVDWKNEQGFKTEVRTLETGFNTSQDFKDYISTLYASDNLEYVLMVGDAYPNGGNPPASNDVPMYYWNPPGEDATYSDTWYVCLDGADDHFADLAIGRFTYDNLQELDDQLQKTLDHYQNPDTSTNWAENSLLVAHEQDYPLKYTQCKEQIRTYNYAQQTPIFTQCYGGAGANNNDIINFVNDTSCGIFNYRGHGSATEFWQWGAGGSFTASHVNQLTNDNRLFVLFDVCCDNMDIVAHAGNCLCESFMKHDAGAVAINGAIIPSYTIPNHDYDKEMYKAVFDEGIHNIGYVTNFANVTVLNVHGTIGRSNVRTYLWLGDSSLEPWTLQPQNLTVTHDAQLFLGLSQMDVNVLGPNGPVEGARVCISNADGSIYGVAFADAAGMAQVQFDGPVQTPGDAKVTVTAHNFLPYQQVIPVIPQQGPYCVYNGSTLNDAAGNNNGMLDYGEAVLLGMEMENVGVTQADNVVVTLSTTDTWITITDATETFGTIGANQTVNIDDAFAFSVDNQVPDGHYILFAVSATDGTNVWDSNFSIEAHAPVISFEQAVANDTANGNGDYLWDAGETVNIEITVANSGSADATDVFGLLTTADPYVTLNAAGPMSYGVLSAGSTAMAAYEATSDAATPEAHLAEFTVDFTAAGGLSGQGIFGLQIGGYLIEEYFDSFPPADWTTSGGNNWQGGSSNNAGGTAPEAHFYWSPSTNGIQRLVSPVINTTGSSTLALQFQHMLDDYSGGYEIRVETTSDGQNWNTVWSENPNANIGPELVEETVSTPDVGSSTFQIAWTFDGNSFNLDHWYVDDIILGGGDPANTGIIAGTVTLDGGTGTITDVVLSCDGSFTSPAANGNYSFVLDPGTYSVTATLDGYDSVTNSNLAVTAGQTTTSNFTLIWQGGNTNPPQNLMASIVDYNDVTLTWDAPAAERSSAAPTFSASSQSRTKAQTDETRALTGFKVYRDATMIHEITDPAVLNYTDMALDAGDYDYYVVAVYDEGESVPSNTESVTISLPAPANFTAVSQGPASSSVLCSWDAPATRNLSQYKIYRDGVEVATTLQLSYEDQNVPTGDYVYYVTAIYSDTYESVNSNSVTVQHTEAPSPLVPTVTALAGNYPNPFNPTTVVRFSLVEAADVQLDIYNVRGEKVKTLVQQHLDAAWHLAEWNGTDDHGNSVGSGIYFYKMRAGKYTSTKKMILMK